MSKVTKKTLTLSVSDVSSAFSTTYHDYVSTLTPRLQLIDLFLVFLVALGVLQFVYVVLVGNFPFNAFLGGFISCVGQFVLVVSLRLQVKQQKPKVETESESEGETSVTADEKVPTTTLFSISPERAFGDFIFASLILHFVVWHFIN